MTEAKKNRGWWQDTHVHTNRKPSPHAAWTGPACVTRAGPACAAGAGPGRAAGTGTACADVTGATWAAGTGTNGPAGKGTGCAAGAGTGWKAGTGTGCTAGASTGCAARAGTGCAAGDGTRCAAGAGTGCAAGTGAGCAKRLMPFVSSMPSMEMSIFPVCRNVGKEANIVGLGVKKQRGEGEGGIGLDGGVRRDCENTWECLCPTPFHVSPGLNDTQGGNMGKEAYIGGLGVKKQRGEGEGGIGLHGGVRRDCENTWECPGPTPSQVSPGLKHPQGGNVGKEAYIGGLGVKKQREEGEGGIGLHGGVRRDCENNWECPGPTPSQVSPGLNHPQGGNVGKEAYIGGRGVKKQREEGEGGIGLHGGVRRDWQKYGQGG
ncbi:unnamed protein product [Closterium sp. NIES-64]|nr:unnamed protein product [Closterium sp. NIES-64]